MDPEYMIFMRNACVVVVVGLVVMMLWDVVASQESDTRYTREVCEEELLRLAIKYDVGDCDNVTTMISIMCMHSGVRQYGE